MSVTGKLSIGVVISELTGQLSYSIPVLFAGVVGLGAGSWRSTSRHDRWLKALPHWPAIHSAAARRPMMRMQGHEALSQLVDDHPPANVQARSMRRTS